MHSSSDQSKNMLRTVINGCENKGKAILKSSAIYYYSAYVATLMFLWILYEIIQFKTFRNIYTVFATTMPSLAILVISTLWITRMAATKCIELNINLCFILYSLIFIFFIGGISTFIIGGLLNVLTSNIISESLHTLLIVPLIEESLKFVMVCIMFMIRILFRNNTINTVDYYYLQISAICYGSAFAMFENFSYVAMCEWDGSELKMFNLTLSCSPEFQQELIDKTATMGILSLRRAGFPIPLHCATPYIMAIFLSIIHYQKNNKIKPYSCIFGTPLILHLMNNIPYCMYLLPFGTIYAIYISQKEFISIVHGNDNEDKIQTYQIKDCVDGDLSHKTTTSRDSNKV